MREELSFEKLINNPHFRGWVLAPTATQDRYWQGVLKNHPESQSEIQRARNFLEGISHHHLDISETRKSEIWMKIRQNASIHQLGKVLPIYSETRYRKDRRGILIAGLAACIALVLAYTTFLTVAHEDQRTQVESLSDLVIKRNPAGQKSKVHLSDGSVVFLNSESTLKYQKDFGKNHRVLELEGEAFFDVAKDSLRPFVVKSGSVHTRALGTSFNVNASENHVDVLLVTGIVQVLSLDNSETKILDLAEKITYTHKKGFSAITKSDLKEIMWKDGIIVFENTSMQEAVKTLEKWYAVTIEVSGTNNGLTFSGQFDNEYLSNVLNTMGFAMGFRYEIRGNKVTLNFIENMEK